MHRLDIKQKTDIRLVDISPDFWYPIAWSKELRRGKTIGRYFGRQSIALIRPKRGPVFALENRCAHRQVPLSKGTVEGDSVKCCYHGWAYGRTGKCLDIPYLGKDENREKIINRVRSYPCREAGGMIFVFPGDPEKADKVPFPQLAQVNNPAFKTRQFNPSVKCHYTFMHENLMDMNHQFLHRRQMGQIRARYLGGETGEDFVEARYSFARTGTQQPLAERLIFGKHTYDPNKIQPVEEVVTIRTTYPYQRLFIHDKDGDLVMELFAAYVPNSPSGKSCQTFGLLSVLRPQTPLLIDIIWPVLGIFTNRIFQEDKEVVEMEQRAWNELGGDRNREVFPIVNKLRDLLINNGITH
ncbi:aromatic ring-hydroxylating oxygenase subunit alpha [Swingsia samuiensis]|uniref:Aromatic ring-hydroxylating dioxygenase subunit alpha n=1 Tax=Swingsia samuiensis TaxID=1293412 RepID=A0A4Y6UGA4_9PROT|nr:aromatic ring-hydroxylating dioxygenase subunit alpha [Swingsia samuiensis]QDH16602.1 aromatic ring-hydroxylating dioxygenase subunit alpha [Swingsia samuiensis]